MFPSNAAALSRSLLRTGNSVHHLTIRCLKSGKLMTPISKTSLRPHLRRLFDSITEPILPGDPYFMMQKPPALRCNRPAVDEVKTNRSQELSPRDLAVRNYIRHNLSNAVVVIICHEHPSDARTQHYEIMEMSSKGVALVRLQEPKMIRSLLEGTSLDAWSSFFEDEVGALTSLMFTKRYVPEEDDGRSDIVSGKVRDRNYLNVAMNYAKKTKWIVPLAVAYENRIMTVREAENAVSMLKDPIRVRGETVALLNTQMIETGRILNEHAVSLSNSLQARKEQLEKGDSSSSE